MILMADKAFELKGSLFTLTVLQLHSFDVTLFKQQLTETVQQAPKFFQNAPIIFDLHRLQNIQCTVDFVGLAKAAKAESLLPIGIIGGNAEHHEHAIAAGLGILPGQYAAKRDEADMEIQQKSETSEATSKPSQADNLTNKRKTKIVTQPVRSGQQIYAKDADLIVTASVSRGAELIADGNIHVYGTLRGRALAGVGGDTQARIFCRTLDAELVSIAGLYQLSDNFTETNGDDFLQVYIKDEKMCIAEI